MLNNSATVSFVPVILPWKWHFFRYTNEEVYVLRVHCFQFFARVESLLPSPFLLLPNISLGINWNTVIKQAATHGTRCLKSILLTTRHVTSRISSFDNRSSDLDLKWKKKKWKWDFLFFQLGFFFFSFVLMI